VNIRVIIILIGVIVIWQIVTSLNLVSTLFFASPIAIIISLYDLFTKGPMIIDIFSTFWRTLLAFSFSVAIGTPLGILIGYYYKFGLSIETLLDFLKSIPPVTLFPLFLFFFGIGDLSKIAVSAFAGAMIIIVTSMYGIRQINKNRLNLAKKIGIKGKKLFMKVLLPESLDHIFSGYRVAASFCLILIIVTEMFLGGAQYGLGRSIIDAQMLYDIPKLYALIFLSGLLGYLLNKSFIIVENKIVHWRGK